MKKKNIFILLSLGLIVSLNPHFTYGQEPKDLPKLIIFHSPSCHRCIEVKREVLPVIEKKFKTQIQIEFRDIDEIENYKLLLSLQEKHKVKMRNTLPVFYFQGHFLNGQGKKVEKNLESLIKRYLNQRPGESADLKGIDLIAHFKSFRPLLIISAGLIDGINPCAFTVIVFFISFLALQGYRRRELIVIGLTFIGTVFLTYILIGLGLFEFFYRIEGFWLISKILNFGIGIFSIVLGFLAVYDFFKFKQTKDAEGLILQLPKSIKQRIHSVIGLHYRDTQQNKDDSHKRRLVKLFVSALITGFLVSLLEAVCTGQAYLPTISFILKTSNLKLQALGYLLLYNLMFIFPLFVIFLFALWGVTSQDFAKFLKQHLLTLKLLMAILFFGFGIFLIARA